jgi:hypothetical protein
MLKFLSGFVLFSFAACVFASEVPCKDVKPLYFENYGVSVPSDWSCVANRDDKSKEFTHGYFFIKGEKRIHLLEIYDKPWSEKENQTLFDNAKEIEPDKTIKAYFNWFSGDKDYLRNNDRYTQVNNFINGSRGILFSTGKELAVVYFTDKQLVVKKGGDSMWKQTQIAFIFKHKAPKELLVTACEKCSMQDMFDALIFPVIQK